MKPVLQALLLADKIYDDRTTGKKVIAGTFNRLLIAPNVKFEPIEGADGNTTLQMPGGMEAGSPSAYFSVTECRGQLRFELRYVDLSDDKVYLSTEINVECNDPLLTIEAVVPMPKLPTPHPGAFALELLCNDEPIGSLRVHVQEIEIRGET